MAFDWKCRWEMIRNTLYCIGNNFRLLSIVVRHFCSCLMKSFNQCSRLQGQLVAMHIESVIEREGWKHVQFMLALIKLEHLDATGGFTCRKQLYLITWKCNLHGTWLLLWEVFAPNGVIHPVSKKNLNIRGIRIQQLNTRLPYPWLLF